MEELKKKIGQDYDRLSRMSIIEEGGVKVLPEPPPLPPPPAADIKMKANLLLIIPCCYLLNALLG